MSMRPYRDGFGRLGVSGGQERPGCQHDGHKAFHCRAGKEREMPARLQWRWPLVTRPQACSEICGFLGLKPQSIHARDACGIAPRLAFTSRRKGPVELRFALAISLLVGHLFFSAEASGKPPRTSTPAADSTTIPQICRTRSMITSL